MPLQHLVTIVDSVFKMLEFVCKENSLCQNVYCLAQRLYHLVQDCFSLGGRKQEENVKWMLVLVAKCIMSYLNYLKLHRKKEECSFFPTSQQGHNSELTTAAEYNISGNQDTFLLSYFNKF